MVSLSSLIKLLVTYPDYEIIYFYIIAGNVLKELVEPKGAVVFSNAFTLGDDSISTLELWGAEYQESNAILLKPEDETMLLKLSQRERCPIDIVGVVTGTGKVNKFDCSCIRIIFRHQ